jgi:transposase-like protein
MKKLIEFKNLRDLEKSLKNEKTCRAFFEQTRWEGQVACPHCGGAKIYTLKPNAKNNNYKCAYCLKKFNCLTGTIFHGTQLPMMLWFKAMFLFGTLSKGLSSPDLANALGVTVKTAWYMMHRLREMLKTNAPEMLEGTVEVDATWIGGRQSNKHESKRTLKRGEYSKSLTPVLGLLQRKGNLVCIPMPTESGTLITMIANQVIKKGSTIYTDSATQLKGLKNHGFVHESVNHQAGEYGRGKVSTNGIEGAFSLFKRKINGVHHWISKKNLNRYLNEFTFRYNHRAMNNYERFTSALKNSETRLLYKELIAKEGRNAA